MVYNAVWPALCLTMKPCEGHVRVGYAGLHIASTTLRALHCRLEGAAQELQGAGWSQVGRRYDTDALTGTAQCRRPTHTAQCTVRSTA